MPSAMTVYALVVVSYFLITGGNARDSNGLKAPGWEERFPPGAAGPSGVGERDDERDDPVAPPAPE